MRWLAHRGGALDFRDHCETQPGRSLSRSRWRSGADPATILGAVTPVPDTLSEYQFAGLLRGGKTELVKCLGRDLQVPASAEIVLEGVIHPGETALEGPYGDHTGYYNEQAEFPVFTIERITMRRDPIYHSHLHRQAAGRAGDARRGAERSVRAAAAEAVPRDRRLLPAARRLLLPPGRGEHEEAVSRPRQARDVRHLELPAPVHVHQVHHRHRRRRRTSATGRK